MSCSDAIVADEKHQSHTLLYKKDTVSVDVTLPLLDNEQSVDIDPSKRQCRCKRRVFKRAVFIVSFIGSLVLLHVLMACKRSAKSHDDSATLNTSLKTGPEPSYPEYQLQRRILNTNLVPFLRFPDRLQQTLNVSYVHELLKDVNKDRRLEEALHPMQDAFVRIITPAEFAVLNKQGVTMEQIDDVALNHYIIYAQYEIDCLAITSAQEDTALYLRVYSRQWQAMRVDIAQLFYDLGGSKTAFEAANYHTHITVGHSRPGKLHDDKVAIDDGKQSCWANIRLVGPQF
ncbi:hypothetical protein BDF19DRAFT_445169 [Syncephalis fuscata]|nr:hypothetical protein BDF19DRAFT_445169 [Syncephalis fuscata]